MQTQTQTQMQMQMQQMVRCTRRRRIEGGRYYWASVEDAAWQHNIPRSALPLLRGSNAPTHSLALPYLTVIRHDCGSARSILAHLPNRVCPQMVTLMRVSQRPSRCAM
jgi:hypothetical protein